MTVTQRVAVLGAGTMGPGIAASFAAAGIPACLWALRPERVRKAAVIARRKHAELVDAGLASASAMGRIDACTSLAEAVAGADVVVEAIAEDVGQKQTLLAETERHVDPTTMVASTTSGLAIDDIAARMERPDRAIALHFWNPAHLMPLVEVAGGRCTRPAVVDAGLDLARCLGKRPVLLHHSVPGFIGTRLQQAVVREAIALLRAGVADAAEIDAATRLSFGARFPVLGPLETSDLGGLDVVAAIHRYLLPDLDASSEPSPLLLELTSAGRLGAKTGRGFYDWRHRDAAALVAARDAELVERNRKLRATGELAEPYSGG